MNLAEAQALRYGAQKVKVYPDWISIDDERKPEVLESVLCHLKSGIIVQMTYGRLVGFFDPYSPLPVYKKNPITHWMPLPPLPTL